MLVPLWKLLFVIHLTIGYENDVAGGISVIFYHCNQISVHLGVLNCMYFTNTNLKLIFE